jgi:hypothetical protein
MHFWVLAELSKHKQFAQIRLSDVGKDPPDGYARTETGEVIKIEVTSAWSLGRRLGDEYKCKERMQHDPVENCIRRVESIPDALEKAINDKLEKLKYSRPSLFALVVDLTFISDGGMRQGETERAIATIKDRYGRSFSTFGFSGRTEFSKSYEATRESAMAAFAKSWRRD